MTRNVLRLGGWLVLVVLVLVLGITLREWTEFIFSNFSRIAVNLGGK